MWIHADHDLVDLTLVAVSHNNSHKAQMGKGELLHTTSEHPFLTTERGFLPAGQLVIGMHILRANGSTGSITGWKIVPGTKVMYNLEVANDHTFTVGDGQWVVHNACILGRYGQLSDQYSGTGQRAHHIYQDAMMRLLPGYSRRAAPAILLNINDHLLANDDKR